MKKLFTMLALLWTAFFVLWAAAAHAATYTYTESNASGVTAAATCHSGETVDQNFTLARSGAATGTITTGNIGAGAYLAETFTSAASDPGITSWDAGNWVAGINVSTANSNVEWTDTCVYQLDSSGALVNTVGSLTGQTTSMGATGLATHTVSGSAESPSATDRIQVVVVFTNTGHGNQTISFTIGTAGNGETVATPIVAPATSQIITISGIGGLKWLENLLQR